MMDTVMRDASKDEELVRITINFVQFLIDWCFLPCLSQRPESIQDNVKALYSYEQERTLQAVKSVDISRGKFQSRLTLFSFILAEI